MKIAITGATGFIGTELISSLSSSAHEIFGLTRKKEVLNQNINYHKVNWIITDYSLESLYEVLKGMDIVIHLAAVRGTEGLITDYHINEIITQNLLESCVKNNIKNFVFISSIAVYSEISKIPWKESESALPKTMYGISKLSCEALCFWYARNYDLKVKCLRLAQVLGMGEHGGMMKKFITQAINKERLIVMGESIAVREYVYIKDVVKAIRLAMNYHKSGLFNIGTGRAYSNLEIATLINKVFDNNNNLEYRDTIKETIESSLMDNSKANYFLNYYPTYTLESALLDIKKQEISG
ncbi:NAD-dependent epimerase/dehydratase family protein [Caldifermentibacillus hisashii]|uniref:NAD-dependent epimerase/dehydratase family protein n=1 Tax=Caldifermentibacillus hisashii TaxID=996558 RepID=UPI0022B9A837|nr:NAD(P)-dependent oxidoreductase [Caldifermentibacillus hisashii]